jgi:hypothetical protein
MYTADYQVNDTLMKEHFFLHMHQLLQKPYILLGDEAPRSADLVFHVLPEQ